MGSPISWASLSDRASVRSCPVACGGNFLPASLTSRPMRAEIAKKVILAAVLTATAELPVAESAPAPPLLERFRVCLALEDMTKERLDCFDAIVRPEPKPVTASPAAITECRFYKEEDERLRCFNSFVAARVPSTTRPSPQPTAQQIPNERFRPCHAMDELTKERLDCFDTILPPAPRAFTAQPKSILECRFYREQDDRLRCYINFTARLFKAVQRTPPPAPPRTQLPSATEKHARVGRGGCGSRGGAGHRTRSGKCASRRR